MSANLLQKVVASCPSPPVVEKTRGVKTPCSMSLTRCPFFFVFMFLVGSFDGSGAVAGRIRVENCGVLYSTIS